MLTAILLYVFVVSPVSALCVGAFIKAGKGPGLVGPGTEEARKQENNLPIAA